MILAFFIIKTIDLVIKNVIESSNSKIDFQKLFTK